MPNIISKIKASNTDYGIRAGYMYYGTTAGTESALTVTIKEDGGNTISIPELVKGMTFALTFHVIPSTSATLSVNGLTGKPIHFSTGLTGKEWVVGETYIFIYNGTAFVAISSYGSITAIASSGSGNVVSNLSLSGSQVTQTFTNCVPGTNTEATIVTLNSDTVIPKTVNGTSTSVGLPTNQYGAVFAEFGVFDKLCTLDGTNATSIHVGSSVQPVYFEDGQVKACNMNLTGPQGLQGYQGYQGKAGKNGTNGTNGSHAYSYINHIGLISGQWNIDELDTTNARTYAIWELTPDTNNLNIFNINAPLNFEHYLLIRNGMGTNLEIVIALDGDFGNADIYADIDTSNSIEVPQDSAVEICYFASLDKTGKKYVTITKSAPLSNSPQLY